MHNYVTEVVSVNAVRPETAIIGRAATLLREGKLVVFPTETVYGLGANALESSAVEQIFAAKERPYSDPLIAHIADERDLERLVADVSPLAQQLASAFWPGPLTLILPVGPQVPERVRAGLPTVAVRMPRHPVALSLIRAAGVPIAAPSANRFTHVSPTTAQHVLADLGGRVPLILDAGPCEVGVESTILDLSSEIPTILRPGGVSLESLRSILPRVRAPLRHMPIPTGGQEGGAAQKAPGQLLIHYAPAVPTVLFEGTAEAMRAALLAEVHHRVSRGERVGVLIADEDLAAFQESGASLFALGSVTNPEQIATRLFSGLRSLEEAGVQVILCRSFAVQGLGLAVRDRLLKAAGGKVISV
jgi:L-threonylcarbamoyladenylate synthase